MKAFILIGGIILFFSACSAKKQSLSEQEFQRSNSASQKALQKLDRE